MSSKQNKKFIQKIQKETSIDGNKVQIYFKSCDVI